MLALNINGRKCEVDVEAETPLLWVLRDTLGLTGTKFGCGVAACGACTVHVDGMALRSCSFPVAAAVGKTVITIEALGQPTPHAIQQAWVKHQVPQCGYCQSGMIMAVAALLKHNPHPNDNAIDTAVSNICRCGTYPRIRAAIHEAAHELAALVPAAA